jgi:hypothetical protein
VREACAAALRLASVRVVCPRLIPDVPLTSSEGLLGAIVPHDEARFYMLTLNNGGLPGGMRHWITGGGKASYVEAAVKMGLALAEELEAGLRTRAEPVTSSEGLPSATG